MNKLEVCCGDMQSVRAAVEGGAQRVELCSALSLDGLTPSAGFIRQAVLTGIDVQVLIRPREGDFVYNADEVQCMVHDIRVARQLGAHGVVIGALTAEGDIDMATCQQLVNAAKEQEAEGHALSITFHRAFDCCTSPTTALEQIIAMGCHRLLTSGQAATAEAGIPLLHSLVEQANGRLIIMPGAGVNPANAARILAATGAREIHGSLRKDGHSHPDLVRQTVEQLRARPTA